MPDLTLLLIDEHNAGLSTRLQTLIEGFAGHILQATVGGDLFTLLEQHRPQLVVMDCLENTAETCARLKAHPKGGSPVILVVCREWTRENLDALFQAGADDCLPGPVHDGVLTARVQMLLRFIRLKHKKCLFDTVFEHTDEGIVVTDRNNRIIAVNNAFRERSGYGEDEVLGQDPAIFGSGRHDQRYFEDMWAALKERGSWRGEIWNRAKGGQAVPEWLRLHTIHDDHGDITHHVALYSDLDHAEQNEQKLTFRAMQDYLTDLPNRLLFFERLEYALWLAQRAQHYVGVMCIDIDHFHQLNQEHGFRVGDLLLRHIAERLEERLRDSDTAARLEGNQFAIVLARLFEPADILLVGDGVRHALCRPFEIDGQTVTITCSIGMSVFPDHGFDMRSLFRKANESMCKAKAAGGNDIFLWINQEPKS